MAGRGERMTIGDTRAGEIELQIPKIRRGSCFPSFLQPRKRSEQALVSVVQPAYVCGVSTRRVDQLVESLGLRISRSEVSRVARGARRACGGVSRAAEAFRREFLRSLVARGVVGIELAISDAHPGLKAALAQVLGAPWQPCTVHFLRDLRGHVRRDQHDALGAITVRAPGTSRIGPCNGNPFGLSIGAAAGTGPGRAVVRDTGLGGAGSVSWSAPGRRPPSTTTS